MGDAVDWAWRLYGEGRVVRAADPALRGEFDLAEAERAVGLALACWHPNPRERPSMSTAVQVLVGGARAPEPAFQKPGLVWPPDGDRQQEMEMARVRLLFTGGAGRSSFCSVWDCSVFCLMPGQEARWQLYHSVDYISKKRILFASCESYSSYQVPAVEIKAS